MTTLQLLKQHRQCILDIAARHGATDVRVFGSTVRGDEGADSDIDLLVRRPEQTSPWFPAGFILELEDLLGRPVDVVTEQGLNPLLREHVWEEARPL